MELRRGGLVLFRKPAGRECLFFKLDIGTRCVSAGIRVSKWKKEKQPYPAQRGLSRNRMCHRKKEAILRWPGRGVSSGRGGSHVVVEKCIKSTHVQSLKLTRCMSSMSQLKRVSYRKVDRM